jgi:nicotinamide-nucleotide amidase
MFREQVTPRLPSTGLLIRRLRINCYGCGESQADELLGDLTARGRDPEIGITAHEATITLRIQAIAATEAECQRKIDEASAAIRDRLGPFVFGVEDEELEHVLVRELARRGETISSVDCGSRGWLAQTLARAAVDHPQVFKGSLTFTNGAAASAFFNEAQSPEQLAAACRDRFQSTYALVIGELPEVSLEQLARGDRQSEVGLAISTGYRRERITLNGNPAILWARLGKTVMNLLRLNP